MSAWLDSLTGWLGVHPQWLGLALFVVACVECLAIAGILVPGTVLLFGIAVLAGSGALDLWQTLLLGYTGGLLGDALSYAVGRRFHQNIRRLPVLRHHPEWIGSAEAYFHRYGVVSLLVGRYIGPLRPMLPMVAGMLDMPLGRFIGVSLIAAAGWSVAYLLPGWTTGAAMRLPLPPGFWADAAWVIGGLALVIGLTVHGSLRGRRWATPVTAGLSLLALLALLLGWPYLHELDQGLLTLIQEQRSAGLDRYMVLLTRLGDLRTQVVVGVLLVGLLLATRQWRAGLFAGGALLGTALANGLLKALFARSRPEVLLEPLSSFSLPSGHSSAAFAFFLTLGILAGRGQPVRWRLTWLLLAGLPALAIALSRVYLGVHWPTDIIAGALLAGGFCAVSLSLAQWHTPLAALSQRIWWLILPACLALLGAFALWALPEALQRYAY
ncbi:bifunctional DedA family/phosphatase PAP2 family protein [Pseudomonas sp. UL073]|uniref:Bifunctional DedA family/phosphatase PAP2 family protein n=1 Tax=Zestomonas insulae TaxID=2809017 RepID=A0ABS2IGU8_9GAMM|nr:bifunctional DedA family/phosphatase PAP2 family protein [Pseudomonas insulae]MBM7061388.1 bifunctional DedA family/phosphatase PAP2 family protein [Pseudomonas insulae]